MIDYLKLQSVSCQGILADNEIKLEPVVWCRIYDRLGIESPFAMSLDHSRTDNSVVSGRRKTYAWLESQPMDHVY